jgi:hypothetical protein
MAAVNRVMRVSSDRGSGIMCISSRLVKEGAFESAKVFFMLLSTVCQSWGLLIASPSSRTMLDDLHNV